MNFAYRLPLLLVLFACAGTVGALPPQRVVMEYDMSYNGTAMAQAVGRLEHDGKSYSLVEEVKGKGVYALLKPGVVRRSARGTVTPQGLRPLEFRDRRGSSPENLVVFDWARQVMLYAREGRKETRPMEMPASLSDRLSFLWTFAFLPPDRMIEGNEIRAVLSDGKGLSTFRYRVSGAETLKTPAGAFQTVKLVKQRDSGDGRTTEIWLAPERNNLPVRILVVEKDGTRIDQTVTSIGS